MDLYTSPLFQGALRYAKSLKPDRIFILSAKHGLLGLDTEIGPYDMTLNDMSQAQVRSWAGRVLEQLGQHVDLQNDHFVLFAGEKYRRYIVPRMASYEVPLQGMPIGKQLQFLANATHERNLR